MTAAATRLTGIALSEACAAWVRHFARHRHIKVREGGVLEEETDGQWPGTVYTIVSVPSLQASEAAENELRDIAGLTGEQWAHGWRERDRHPEIKVYPQPPDDFVERLTDGR